MYMYSHMQLELTVGFWVWLNAVDNVGVCHEEVGDLPRPLVPHEHPPTVAAAHHPVLTPKVGLLDLWCVCVCVCV